MSPPPTEGAAGKPSGLLARLTRSVRARLAPAQHTTAQPSEAAPMSEAHQAKTCTAAQAVAAVRNGDHVFVGTACATPRQLVAALEALSPAPAGIELLHFLTDQALLRDDQGQVRTRYRHRCFFVGAEMRDAVRQGRADYVPVALARVPALMAIGRIPVDVALIQVSPPDSFGYVSLGLSVDIVAAAVAQARLVIAELNPAMPCSMGDSMLHIDQIDHLVMVDTPVLEYRHPATDLPAMVQIARYVSSLIDDGSTLQIGMGRVVNETLRQLDDRRDLGIHTDVLTDAIIPLLEKGIVTGRCKTQHRGKITASLAMGTQALYALIDRNPLFNFQPIDAVCDPQVLAAQYKLVSVTQAFAVDLTGQVCADQFEGEFYGGVGVQGDFLQGAASSAGGKAIICLAATDGCAAHSRIRAQLLANEGVTIARSDVHYVVTEFGIAYLFGKSIRERAVALIQIAHPAHRPALFEAARGLGYLPAQQQLRNLRAYAVQDELSATLKGGQLVLLRPATASDGEGLRALFHRMNERDVYTRFFRKLRSLSNSDLQRLINLDEENELAVLAVTGPREQPVVIGHAMYALDASTNLAETAFIVHPDWRGQGLGGQLQARLATLAKARGVRGFVAEMLVSNEAMIRLARSGGQAGKIEDLGGTWRVTTLL